MPTLRLSCGSRQYRLDLLRLDPDVMLGCGGARRGVRAGQGGGPPHRLCQSGFVERVDQHARLGRDELGRPADPRGDDRAPTGHGLEQRLAEGLDRGRLAEYGRLGDELRDLLMWDAARDLDVRTP